MTGEAPVFLAWFTLALAIAWRRRPAPSRIRALVPPAPARPVEPARRAAGAHALAALLERLGGAVLRRLRRPAGAEVSRRLGTALVVALFTMVALPPAAVPAALVVWALPGVKARRRCRRHLAAIAADLPDVVDLLVLAVGAGFTVRLAVAAVARRSPGPLGAELARALEEADLGRRLADALDDLPERAGEATRPLAGALIASERYGAPLGASLERLAQEVRADRRRRAEEAARKVPVKLLFPLVSCTLPAFGLLTVAPLIASAVRSLRL
jgi:tight adherence protein C